MPFGISIVVPKGKREWFRLLGQSFVGGVIGAVTTGQVNPSEALHGKDGLKRVGVALVGAGVAAAWGFVQDPKKGRAEQAEKDAQEAFDKTQKAP